MATLEAKLLFKFAGFFLNYIPRLTDRDHDAIACIYRPINVYLWTEFHNNRSTFVEMAPENRTFPGLSDFIANRTHRPHSRAYVGRCVNRIGKIENELVYAPAALLTTGRLKTQEWKTRER